MEKKEYFLQSSTDGHPIWVGRWSGAAEKRNNIVVQLVHGSCEHARRYEGFIAFLVARGFIVYANDHRGHGKTVQEGETFGYFGAENGWTNMVMDLYDVTKEIKKREGAVKIVMLGHSMGSFLARHYGILYSNAIDGLILSGTAEHEDWTLSLGIGLAEHMIKKGKGKEVPTFLDRLSYGAYGKRFKKEKDEHAWLSRDVVVRNAFRDDPLSGFKFTATGFRDMFLGLQFIKNPTYVEKVRKDLPIFILSGTDDPVGDYGKMVEKCYKGYKEQGVVDVSLKLYEGMRHEILNEIGKEKVYKDILDWIRLKVTC